MNRSNITTLAAALAVALVLLLPCAALAQPGTPANSVIGFPGAGVLQAGDLWDSFLPQAFGPYYGEGATYPTQGARQFIRFGNFDRGWSTPNAHWPAAFHWTIFWSHYMHAQVFHADSNFNPTKQGVAAPATGNWGQVTYKPGVLGDGAPRKYSVEPYFVDGTRRQHAVYEAGWPTNTGCDVKIRAHAWTGPNWNNFNDFVILEIEFKNTGQRDMNLDGAADAALADPAIQAISLVMSGEIFMSVSSYLGGGRNENLIGEKFTRMGGWVGDPDPSGNPWGFVAYYAGARTQSPTAGNFNMGYNGVTKRAYTDIWIGWDWLGAKSGGLPTDPTQLTNALPTRNTIFGTHPVGTGGQQGWYLSAGSGGSLAGRFTDPKEMFTVGIGEFARNGGSSRTLAQLDLSPNPAFFASGTTGDVTTWVPLASPGQPNGDQKTLNTFDQTPLEDGTGYPTGWGKWTTGYNFAHDFNGDLYSGIGPVRIEKDSSVTFVLAIVGGYRLEGVQKAVRAARYVYANGSASVPVLPALPDMKVSNTLTKSVRVEWDDRAEADPEFQGYKIWKSSNFKKKAWLDEGMRLADRYQEQMTVGADITSLKKPVNPKFDAFAEVAGTSLKGLYQPDTWGTWELVKVVPKADLATFPKTTTPGYKYLYEDKDVVLGFSYWYYVSAYKEGTYTGPAGETTARMETHSTNRDGANGLWQKTFPFAPNNPNYPKTAAGKKDIGAVQVVYSALAAAGDVANVGVRPNPYKRAALHDNFSNVYDHKLLFYNLPPQCKITILDVSGQIIDQFDFSSSDPSLGATFWDMFSKDGIEVASGLYIYVVESPTGGKKTGYFSILR
ncbi:MAG: hypothetical protein AB1428_08415 [Bacteroidota bacterium]